MKSTQETVCHRIKLKPNSLEKVYAWAKELNSRKEEALATLQDEGVSVESVFLEQTNEGDFLIYYMRLENTDKAKAIAAKSKHAIDEYHKQFKIATWASNAQLQLLVDLDLL